jgi:hypothetical protein
MIFMLMKTSLRHKFTIAALAVYFPVLLILTHIPIPDVVFRAGVSDKWLHFTAFMILSFLAWFSVNPEKKVRINFVSFWVMLFLVSLYAVLDEITQLFVQGRTFDLLDLTANMSGVSAGLVFGAVFSFWGSLLSVIVISIFVLENLCRTDPAELVPLTNITFHFAGYFILTLIWNYIIKSSDFCRSFLNKVAIFAMPVIFLVITYTAKHLLDRPYQLTDIVISIMGILTGLLTGKFFMRKLSIEN